MECLANGDTGISVPFRIVNNALRIKETIFEANNSGGLVIAYTGGCCIDDGSDGAQAGAGVWFGPNHPLNISERIPGLQTKNRADILAVVYAAATVHVCDARAVEIRTDSEFVINCMTKWIEGWKMNDWKNASDEPIINRPELQELENLSTKVKIHYVHVPGHRADMGNEEADKLAEAGAAKEYF